MNSRPHEEMREIRVFLVAADSRASLILPDASSVRRLACGEDVARRRCAPTR